MIEVLPAEDENIEEKMNELKEEVEETKNIFGRPDIVIDEMVVEIGYDDFKKQPCFLLKSAKTHVKEKNDKKKNKNIPF